jgi:hypothetical protein
MKKIITLIILSYMNLSYALEFIVLDDFEEASIQVVNESQTDPKKRFLWNQYESDFTEGPDPGTASIDNQNGFVGENNLKVDVTDGNIYIQFYPYNGGWQNVQSFIEGWTNDKYNKLRFWVKLPNGIVKPGDGRKNVTVGTYVRATWGDISNAEDGGGHFYHSYEIESTGEWQQIIVDMHPDHERGASGGAEHNYVPYRTGEVGHNYFDTMTRFYFEIDDLLPAGEYPATFLLDRFEFIQDTNDENYEQINSMTGVYIPSSNTISVNWRRRKDEPNIVHELRYSFRSIQFFGWDNALPFTGVSSVKARNDDYNGMEYVTSSVDLLGNQSVFIAIKPENSNRFREIEIPMDPESFDFYKVRAQPPASLSIQ